MKRLVLFVVLASLICPGVLSAEQDKPEKSAPPLGAWKQMGTDKINFIRLEPRRMVQFSKGTLHFVRMKYMDQRLIGVDMFSREKPMERYRMKGDQLVLTTDAGKETVFEPLKVEPPELNPPAIVFGKIAALPPEKVADVQQELARREKANIAIRFDWRKADKDKDKDKAAEILKEMQKIDDDDTTWFIAQTKEIGWIDVGRFDLLAQDSAYLIVMHTRNLKLMEAALPEFEKSVNGKTFDAERYAGLVDRFHLLTGQPERYGMHISTTKDGKVVAGPLEDRQHVDDLRKAIGLPPLATYLERYKAMNGGKEVEVLKE